MRGEFSRVGKTQLNSLIACRSSLHLGGTSLEDRYGSALVEIVCFQALDKAAFDRSTLVSKATDRFDSRHLSLLGSTEQRNCELQAAVD